MFGGSGFYFCTFRSLFWCNAGYFSPNFELHQSCFSAKIASWNPACSIWETWTWMKNTNFYSKKILISYRNGMWCARWINSHFIAESETTQVTTEREIFGENQIVQERRVGYNKNNLTCVSLIQRERRKQSIHFAPENRTHQTKREKNS